MLHCRTAASRGSLSALGSAVPCTHFVMQEGDTPMASASWMRWMPLCSISSQILTTSPPLNLVLFEIVRCGMIGLTSGVMRSAD